MELHAGSAVVSRCSTGPVGPRRDGLEVGAPDAGADGAARKGDGLRPQAVDVVVAIDSDSRVVDAGDKAAINVKSPKHKKLHWRRHAAAILVPERKSTVGDLGRVRAGAKRIAGAAIDV